MKDFAFCLFFSFLFFGRSEEVRFSSPLFLREWVIVFLLPFHVSICKWNSGAKQTLCAFWRSSMLVSKMFVCLFRFFSRFSFSAESHFFPNSIFRYDNSTDKCPAAINYPVTKSYLRSCFDRKKIKVDQITKTADANISNGKKPLSLHLDLWSDVWNDLIRNGGRPPWAFNCNKDL